MTDEVINQTPSLPAPAKDVAAASSRTFRLLRACLLISGVVLLVAIAGLWHQSQMPSVTSTRLFGLALLMACLGLSLVAFVRALSDWEAVILRRGRGSSAMDQGLTLGAGALLEAAGVILTAMAKVSAMPNEEAAA